MIHSRGGLDLTRLEWTGLVGLAGLDWTGLD